MQVSHIIRALPVVVCLAASLSPPVGAAQGRYRLTTDGEWFHSEPGGRRLARLARGAVVGGGATQGEWMHVTVEGWIFATSVGPSPRADFDLVVTQAPDENLRSAPGGALVGRLAEGFGLRRLGQEGRWVRVSRDGWVRHEALAVVADVTATRTPQGPDSTASAADTAAPPPPAAASPGGSRVQPRRGTTLYRGPDGPEAGTVAPGTPVRRLSQMGDWARVQVEGWVKVGDLETGPPGVLVGVTAAELRAEPQRYAGQLVRWTLQYIAVQRADELRPDLPAGSRYILARGPLPERGFVYVMIPDGRLPAVQALAPLADIQVIARVRASRSRYLGNPVVELMTLEAVP